QAADPGCRRGARERGAGDAAHFAVRGLRRADRGAPLQRLDLDRAVRALERRPPGDGARRRDRAPAAGRACRGLRRGRVVLGRARRQARIPPLHAPGGVPGVARSRRAALGQPRRGRALAEGTRSLRNPVDRLTAGLPRGWRVTIDWLVTIVGAILIVLAVKQWVINPYRIPSSSMEPTLHCARPAPRCPSPFSPLLSAIPLSLPHSIPP